jgi:HEAT repeat protein
MTAVAGMLPAQDDPEVGAFSRSYLNPPELQFSCVGVSDPTEEKYAEQLTKGDPAKRLAAARVIWRGHSRRYAADVLKFLAGPPPGGEAYRALQREVEASLRPQAISQELREGDYLWGTWLAFLRPHPDLVPALLDGLKRKPDQLPETTLALGNSRDLRAYEPLLELLNSKEYRTAGDAAQALGYLGFPEVEPKLIDALSRDNGWLQVHASLALAKVGTRRAIPALERLANDNRFTGALDVRGCAQRALEEITKRDRR